MGFMHPKKNDGTCYLKNILMHSRIFWLAADRGILRPKDMLNLETTEVTLCYGIIPAIAFPNGGNRRSTPA
jgi:hypothetical protein